MTRAGSPHSDTLGSQPASRLPEAYRRPPRPSSAPDAKASTERPKKTNTTPSKTQRTKILASTIQITTNPPTTAPTSTTAPAGAPQATQGAPPQNPTACAHPHTQDAGTGTPTPQHQSRKIEGGSERASRATTRNPRDQTPHRRPPPTALALPHLFS